jgi:proteasome lid subunit RPN8/RPN11/DNA-directed RNA polymerase subunit RPC12/RpoP
VLEEIRGEVEEDRDLRHGERETGGVLFGLQEPDRIRILARKRLPCEHAMGPGFVLSDKDEKRLAQIVAASGTDADLKGLQSLGWYHSHIRSRIFLSERDQKVHARYFGGPFQVALVVHPETGRPTRAGFFFRESSGDMRTESSYEEFTIGTPQQTAPEVKPEVVSKQPSSHGRTTSRAKPEQQQPEVTCPRCGSKHLRRSRRTGPIEHFREFFGSYPYRCHECLSRSFQKTSSSILERSQSSPRKRQERRKRAWQRTRREMLLWGGGVLGFLAILYYLIRDTGPKSDAP